MTELTREVWLNGLKVGDEVAVHGRGFGDRVAVYKVEKLTPTQIVVRGDRYDKATGRERGASAYDRMSLEPVTEEVRQKIRRDRLLVRIDKSMRNFNLHKMPLQQLEAIAIAMGLGEQEQ